MTKELPKGWEKHAKLTKAELETINGTLEGLVEKGVRPLVLLGLAAHCIGFVSFSGGGTKESLMELVKNCVEV